MVQVIETHFWNPHLKFKKKIEYTFTPLGEDYKLRTPVLTSEIVKEILLDLKKQREQYLLTSEIPTILETIGTVTERWLDPMYKGRQLAQKVLPLITGFSPEMIETWGFGRFLSILKKENFPIFNKLNHQNFQDFSAHGDGWVKAYGTHEITHSNHDPALIGHICAGNIVGIGAIEIIMIN